MSVDKERKVKEALRSSGKRITPQRMLLLDIIRERGGHLDADEIYRLAKKREPRLSLSTVYRTLAILKELGLVEELHFDEEHHHYEIKGERAEHYHLICLGCGQVVEFESPLTEGIKGQVSQEHGFEIISAHMDLHGYCRNCRQKKT